MSTTITPLQGAEFWKDKTKELAEPDKNASPSLALTAEQSSQTSLNLCWGIECWADWREAAKQIKITRCRAWMKRLLSLRRTL